MGMKAMPGNGSNPTAQVTDPTQPFPALPPEGIDLESLEKHYIIEAIQRARGDDREAARLLNMSYYTFRYRKKKLAHQLNEIFR
jgi:DNA-binding NtrC family response regulator